MYLTSIPATHTQPMRPAVCGQSMTMHVNSMPATHTKKIGEEVVALARTPRFVLCSYVYMYVCLFSCMYACMPCVYINVCVWMHACMLACMHGRCIYVCMYLFVYGLMYVCMNRWVDTSMYLRTYVRILVCIRVKRKIPSTYSWFLYERETMCACAHVCVGLCVCARIFVCQCFSVHVCVCC